MQDFKGAPLGAPLSVAGRQLPSNLVLAPMAGLGHIILRDIIRSFGGPGLLFTGMLSAKALPTENPRVSPVFNWREEELPYLVGQIFGSEPAEMAAAARRLEQEGFAGVDINMGCSVAAIVKRGAGAALLRDPARALAVAAAVREAVGIPVWVKLRTGWSTDVGPAVELVRCLAETGVDALCFHPRIAPDRRSQQVRLPHLREIVRAVNIPVFGNGNLQADADVADMAAKTGCAGFSIGRMAVARPWIFTQWLDPQGFKAGYNEEDLYRQVPYRMLAGLFDYYEPGRARVFYKRYLAYYAANFTYGSRLLGRLLRGDTFAELKSRLDEHLDPLPEVSIRPNAHLFT